LKTARCVARLHPCACHCIRNPTPPLPPHHPSQGQLESHLERLHELVDEKRVHEVLHGAAAGTGTARPSSAHSAPAAGAGARGSSEAEDRVVSWRLQTVNLTAVTREYIAKLLDAVEAGTLVAPAHVEARGHMSTAAATAVSPKSAYRGTESPHDEGAAAAGAGAGVGGGEVSTESRIGRVRRAHEAGLSLVVGVQQDHLMLYGSGDEEEDVGDGGVAGGSGATPGRRSTKRPRPVEHGSGDGHVGPTSGGGDAAGGGGGTAETGVQGERGLAS
jgi:hypothetical protein